MGRIRVVGARQNNLTGIDVELDTDVLTVLCGRSGSGKSSLAFDTLHAEGQRRYLEALSLRIRQAVGGLPRPDVDHIEGLPPTVAVGQRTGRGGGTVSTRADLELPSRVLFARAGVQHCPETGEPIVPVHHDHIVDRLSALAEGTRLTIEAPVRVHRDGLGVLDEITRAGFSRVRVAGEMRRVEEVDGARIADGETVRIVVDRIRVRADRRDRIDDAVRTASRAGRGAIVAVAGEDELVFVDRPYSLAADRLLPELRPALFSPRGPDACTHCDGKGCEICEQSGLGEGARSVRLEGRSWLEVSRMALQPLLDWLRSLAVPEVGPVLAEMIRRLELLCEVGLGYLSLSTSGAHLSTGEDQRVRLTRQVASELSGVLVILDEPTAGLDERAVQAIITVMRRLVDAGNGLVVVEHHPAVLRAADRVLEFGPGPGRLGGQIVFDGDPDGLATADTATGRALRGEFLAATVTGTTGATVVLEGCQHRNLVGDPIAVARGGWTAVTGPSGAGKSAVLEGLATALRASLEGNATVKGAEGLERILDMEGGDVHRSRRSMPATYVGMWEVMRPLLAATQEAQVRGFSATSFSLNATGGRCEACLGQGERRVELGFLPPVHLVCDVCEGRRFARDVLEVTWKGRSAAELLAMTAAEAHVVLAGHPKLERALRALGDVGLGYVALGQPTRTLSGGEARRLKLARELSRAYRRGAEDTVFLLDAPAVGLHAEDVHGLASLCERLVEQGATIVMATHDPLLVHAAGRVLSVGPGAGSEGGTVRVLRG